MNNLLTALRIVFPTIVYMGIGILLRRTKVVVESEVGRLNQFIFKLFLPLAMFSSLYSADLKTLNDPKLFWFVGLGIFVTFLIVFFFASRKIKDKEVAATFTQGIYRSCYVLIGIPLALSLSGGVGEGKLFALAAVVAPVNTVTAVWLFEQAKGEHLSPLKMAWRILKNPLIVACILGIGLNLLGKPLPDIVVSPLEKLGDAATPVSLVVLGAALNFEGLRKNRKLVSLAVFFGLIVVPTIMISAAALMGFRNATLAAVIGSFAAPNDLVSAPMAYAMGGDGQLASEIVAVSTILSVFTIFIIVLIVLNTGLIVLPG